MPLVAIFFFFSLKLSFNCLLPDFVLSFAGVHWTEHIVLGSLSQLLRSFKDDTKWKGVEKQACYKCCHDSLALKTNMKDLKVTWKTMKDFHVNLCVMMVWWNVWEAVSWILLNSCKKVPDGDFHSGSEGGNMSYIDRIILIDGFSYF